MVTRDNVLSKACNDCIKELYSFVQPRVDWDKFVEENKIYTASYNIWEAYRKAYNNKDENPEEWNKIKEKHPDWDENKSISEIIGPRPFEFYYLPKDILKDICDNYIRAYRIDSQQELLNTIQILKNYCNDPIVDKYIEGNGKPGDKDYCPGHRGYDHPDNLEKKIEDILFKSIYQYDLADLIENDPKYKDNEEYPENEQKYVAEKLQIKFFEFLDMAGNFYNWNRDLNSFNMTVYLGPSPNSNKEAVIENWKKYRNQDIEIDEEEMKKEYYGDDEGCDSFC